MFLKSSLLITYFWRVWLLLHSFLGAYLERPEIDILLANVGAALSVQSAPAWNQCSFSLVCESHMLQQIWPAGNVAGGLGLWWGQLGPVCWRQITEGGQDFSRILPSTLSRLTCLLGNVYLKSISNTHALIKTGCLYWVFFFYKKKYLSGNNPHFRF